MKKAVFYGLSVLFVSTVHASDFDSKSDPCSTGDESKSTTQPTSTDSSKTNPEDLLNK